MKKAISITSSGSKINLRQFLILNMADEVYTEKKKEKGNNLNFDAIQEILIRVGIPAFKEHNLQEKGNIKEKNISRAEYLELVKSGVAQEAAVAMNKKLRKFRMTKRKKN